MKDVTVVKEDISWKKKVGLFLVSQNISLFGSSTVSYAIIWHITLQTSSGKWMMFLIIASLLPQIIISLWAGVWADRYNRKYIIMLADGFIALATLSLSGMFFLGYQSMEFLLFICAVRSIGAGVQMPAVSAVYPQIVPKSKLTKVMGINQTINSVLLLLSPAVGGVILGTIGIMWAFMLDVLTASIAIGIFSFIKIGKIEQIKKAQSIFDELKEGIKFTFGNQLLKRTIICCGFLFFLITPVAFLTPIMIERSFGNEVWRLTANEVFWTIGSLLGGIFVSWHGQFNNKVRTMGISIIVFGITFGLLGVAKTFYIYLAIVCIAGFFMPVISTAQTVLIQENVEITMMGRVFSVVQIISGSSLPIAMLLFGPLADIVSVESILIVTGVLMIVLGIVFAKDDFFKNQNS